MKGERCYITDRRGAGGMDQLIAVIAKNVRAGIDYVQIREKDLSTPELTKLVRETVEITKGRKTRVLVNDRIDVALACGADGVQLRSDSITPEAVRAITPSQFVIGVSCHTHEDLERAVGADFALFSPVYATAKGPGVGIKALARACKSATLPVFALGGVTLDCEQECLEAGAAGIAGIRLFQ